MRVELSRTSSKPGFRHRRQASYTILRQIGGCLVQPKRSCDNPSAARAGPVALLRQTGLPSLVTIGTPLIVVDWAKCGIAQHSQAQKSRSENPRSESPSWKGRMAGSGFGAEMYEHWGGESK